LILNLLPAARNAVGVCLRIQPSEKVTIITDDATGKSQPAWFANWNIWALPTGRGFWKKLSPRPLGDLPRESWIDLETSQVSIFAVQAQANELGSRMQMTEVVNRRKIRHATWSISTGRSCWKHAGGLPEVDRISTKVVETVRRAKQVRAKTSAGNRSDADLNPEYRWLKTSGIISPDKWGNLPGGEVFTTPGEVNGIFVIDGVVGDWAVREIWPACGRIR